MPKFSKRSQQILDTCHPDLVYLMRYSIQDGPDFSIISGQRGRAEQNTLFDEGKSKLRYPKSKHNHLPTSLAVDVAPYPIDWKNDYRFMVLGGWILHCASVLRIPIIWGGDWNQNWNPKDNWIDAGHFELKEC